MIEIFIPVVFMCLNGNCNFMQAQNYYKSEAQCRVSIDNQKAHLAQMAEKADRGQVTILEGTCINAKVEDPKSKV